MGEFSITHWLVVLVIVVLFFGPSKLPGLGKSLGEAIRGFKKGISEMDNEINEEETQKIAQRPAVPNLAEKTGEKTKTDSHS